MRKIMQEGDLIVAEVHSVNNDKTYNLHTRNPKYGRLEPGKLVQASHRQIKRQKHHLISIGKVGLIFGNNGNLYLSNFRRNEATNLKEAVVLHQKYSIEEINDMTVVGNLLRILSFQGLEISEVLLKELYEWIRNSGIDAFSILGANGEVKEELLSRVRERIPKRIEEISSSFKKN